MKLFTHYPLQQTGFSILIVMAIILIISTLLISAGLLTFYQLSTDNMQQEINWQKQHEVEEIANRLEAYLIFTRQLANSTEKLVAPIRKESQQVEILIERLLRSAPPKLIYGIGVWFEPYQFSPQKKYFGPYVHRDLSSPSVEPILTYEWTDPEYDFHRHDWYLAGKHAQGDIVFTEPYFDTDLVYMSACKAFYDENQNFMGIISVDMVLPQLRQFILELNTKNKIVYVSTAKNSLFTHPQQEKILHFINLIQGQDVNNILDVKISDLKLFNQLHLPFKHHLQFSAPVEHVNWQVHLIADQDFLYKEIYRLRNTISSVIIVLWLMLLVGLPILLRAKANTDQIKAQNVRLEVDNEELEKRVKERTTELENAYEQIRALNADLQTENIRMSAELEITHRLQQMLLPKEQELEKVFGLDIAGFMQPAAEVGGDYYDVLQYDGMVKIGIGDVTGHGLESSVLMLMVQTAVRTLLIHREVDTVKFFNTLNRIIYDNVNRMGSEKNLTLMLLDYRRCEERAELNISGQHEEMIVVRANGEIECIDTIDLGFPIGLEMEITTFIGQKQVHLEVGDVAILYTDGVTEAENANKVFYGLQRLCKIAHTYRHENAQTIRQVVIEDIQRHIGDHIIYDDITLLVLKQTGN